MLNRCSWVLSLSTLLLQAFSVNPKDDICSLLSLSYLVKSLICRLKSLMLDWSIFFEDMSSSFKLTRISIADLMYSMSSNPSRCQICSFSSSSLLSVRSLIDVSFRTLTLMYKSTRASLSSEAKRKRLKNMKTNYLK